MDFIKIPPFLASITCLFLLSCESNVKPPLNFATGDFAQFSDKLESLIEYEKKNRNQFDTILLDFVLGSSNTDYDKVIEQNWQKGLLVKDSSINHYNGISILSHFYRLNINGLPNLILGHEFIYNKLESIYFNYDNYDKLSMTDKEYEIFTASINNKYGDNNLLFEDDDEKINIWVKGDLKIEIKEIYTKYEGYHNVYLKYSKLSILENGKKKVRKILNKKREIELKREQNLKKKLVENASKHL